MNLSSLQKGKVDHRSKKSKDLADFLAEIIFGLTTQRRVWMEHEVSVNDMYKAVKILRSNEWIN